MKYFVNKFMRGRQTGGYSIAELMVAVFIVSITIIALVSVLRKGSELTITEIHQKRARALIDSCFESSSYQADNYAGLAAVNRGVVIDPRNEGDAGDNLYGSLIITVATDSNTSTGTNIEYKLVTISVSWQEPEGEQSITLEKYLTQL